MPGLVVAPAVMEVLMVVMLREVVVGNRLVVGGEVMVDVGGQVDVAELDSGDQSHTRLALAPLALGCGVWTQALLQVLTCGDSPSG